MVRISVPWITAQSSAHSHTPESVHEGADNYQKGVTAGTVSTLPTLFHENVRQLM